MSSSLLFLLLRLIFLPAVASPLLASLFFEIVPKEDLQGGGKSGG
jgi:hypothetical protein